MTQNSGGVMIASKLTHPQEETMDSVWQVLEEKRRRDREMLEKWKRQKWEGLQSVFSRTLQSKKPANQARVEKILEHSDIVWSRYGSETIEELAEKIVKALIEQEK